MNEWILRFLIGGAIVSVFSLFGDIFRPKSFAGVFGAAPSVAIATLSLTIAKQGHSVASQECRSMIFGAAALGLYSFTVAILLMKYRLSAFAAASGAILIWVISSAALLALF